MTLDHGDLLSIDVMQQAKDFVEVSVSDAFPHTEVRTIKSVFLVQAHLTVCETTVHNRKQLVV